MKNLIRFITLTIVASLALLSVTPLSAQEATAVPESEAETNEELRPIVCESSLILLVGLAQRDYGFQPTEAMSQFERGQYEEYYETLHSDGPVSQEGVVEATPDMDMGESTDTTETTDDQDTTVILEEPVVLEEDTRCTELRRDVIEYFATIREPMRQNDTSEDSSG